MLTLPVEYFLLLLLIEALIIFISAIKWKIVLRKTNVSLKNIISTSFVGYLVNNITPIGIAGGEPVRAYLLYKIDKKVSMARSFASVIVDLFLEILPIFLLALISIILIILRGIRIEIAFVLSLLTLILLALFIISVSMVINKALSIRLINIFVKILSSLPMLNRRVESMKPRIDEIYEKFTIAIRKSMTDTRVLIYGTLISLGKWILVLCRVYLIFLALNVKISFSQVLIAETAVIVLSGIPLLPGALGIWEGTSVVLFTQIAGILPSQAAAATLIDRILFYLIPSVIGSIFAIHFGVNILKSEEMQKEIQIKSEILRKNIRG
jgi:hypothetical protein